MSILRRPAPPRPQPARRPPCPSSPSPVVITMSSAPATSSRRCRVRGAGERRQRDRRGDRRHPDPRSGVQRPGERGRGRADDHPPRRDRRDRHHRRGRGLAARARPPMRSSSVNGGEIPLGVRRTVVPAAPDACLQALERWGHDDLPRRGGARGALRIPGLPLPPRDARLRAPVRGRHAALAGERRDLDARRRGPGAGDRLVQADLGRVLQFLCDEERAAGDDRMAGLAAVRRAFYRGDVASRILAHHSASTTGSSRRKTWNRSAAPSCPRCHAASASTARRSKCIRAAPVPGTVPARSARHRRGGRRRGARARHRWLPARDRGDPQAHVR